jgi:hypothetical protein
VARTFLWLEEEPQAGGGPAREQAAPRVAEGGRELVQLVEVDEQRARGGGGRGGLGVRHRVEALVVVDLVAMRVEDEVLGEGGAEARRHRDAVEGHIRREGRAHRARVADL